MARANWARAAMLAALLAAVVLAPFSAPAADDPEVAAYRRAVEQRFAAWLQALWPDAEAAGVSRATFDANLKGLKLNWSLPHLVLPNPAGPDGPPLPQSLVKAMAPKHQPEFELAGVLFQRGDAQRARGDGACQGRAIPADARRDPEAIWRAGEHRRRHLGTRDGLRQDRCA